MSQYRQSNSTAAADAGIAPDADTLVASYAEDLMDEIFDDVDRILDGDESAIYADPPTQDYESSASPLFSAEAVTIPAMIVPVTTDKTVEPIPGQESPEPTTPVVDDPDTSGKAPKARPWGAVMLGLACVSALAAAGIWQLQQSRLQATGSAAAPTISEEMAFGEYLNRSLQVISGERSARVDSQNPSAVATAPVQAGDNQTQQGRSPGVIERVFVPLLQPSNSGVQRPASPATPSTPSAPGASLPAPNVEAPSAAAQPNATDAAPATTPAPVPNIAVAGTYELVGVLELGNRSAALFEVNGASQRVNIGETIGGSGWSIVSIANEEVVVRRNGEVRSIYIGQQF